jgi:hypothetical protein
MLNPANPRKLAWFAGKKMTEKGFLPNSLDA